MLNNPVLFHYPQVETLEADAPKRRLMRQGEPASLTEAELNSLRQEINEQEVLLKGYQVRG